MEHRVRNQESESRIQEKAIKIDFLSTAYYCCVVPSA